VVKNTISMNKSSMLVDTKAAMPTPTRAGKSNTISCEHQVKEATYIDLSLFLSYFDSATRKTIPSVVDFRLRKYSSLLRIIYRSEN
jgi:hypothetical protein